MSTNKKYLSNDDIILWNNIKDKVIPLEKNIVKELPFCHISIEYPKPIIYILDLHGYTIQEAYDQLKIFINKHKERKSKYIIVITGKGKITKEGVIHKEIKDWLLTKEFKEKIKSSEWINGNGALKIFLKS